MNYYNPYFYSMPISSSTGSGLSGLFSKINFSSIVNGTSKTLNLVNQALPIFKQMSPVVRNAKTMFKVMSEFKKSEPISNDIVNTNDINSNQQNYTNETSNYTRNINTPTFFA